MQYILIFKLCVTVGDISEIQNSFYLIRYNSTSRHQINPLGLSIRMRGKGERPPAVFGFVFDIPPTFISANQQTLNIFNTLMKTIMY